jgi:hypothetical protein
MSNPIMRETNIRVIVLLIWVKIIFQEPADKRVEGIIHHILFINLCFVKVPL